MQETILTCDLCKGGKKGGPVVFATASLTLANGKPQSDRRDLLDVCARHARWIIGRVSRPRFAGAIRAALAPSQRPTDANRMKWRVEKRRAAAAKAATTQKRGPLYWVALERAVLHAMNGQPQARPEIEARAKLTKTTTYAVLRRLVEQQRVTMQGNRGKWRRYIKVAPPATKRLAAPA
jgi:hypothetical protein